jgi:hydroxybutyrate-dimer hydrolase
MNRIVSRAAVAAFVLGLSNAPVLADDAPIQRGSLKIVTYDGVTDDLLSAGLNLAGLVSAVPPGFVDANNPTAVELRRRALYNNYRAIVDPVPAGGMGLLWGPGSAGAPVFAAPVVPGLIPGVEYKAYLRAPERHPHVNNIPAAVQIPAHFNQDKPCIVLAAPSGSRSLYGAISIAEWGLFKGCAVALPGKGTDTGFHLLDPSAPTAAYAVDDLDGVASSVDALGDDAQFAVRDSRQLDKYIAANPNRVATKHAHSQINPERLWGEFGLQGIEFAFWALNDHFHHQRFTRKNTLVIAAGASNGGGMALRAVEDDGRGLIDGVVVTEPNIQPRDGRFVIKFGDDAPFDPNGRTLYDSITTMSVFAACAAHAPGAARTLQIPAFIPLTGPQAAGVERCKSLKDKGLITGDTLAEQAESARAAIRAHGYAAAEDWGIASHDTLGLWRSLQVTYANAYGRFAVEDNLCGMSFAATDALGKPAPLTQAQAAQLFAQSSGVPGTGGVNIIADQATNSPILEPLAVSRSTGGVDLNIDSALCFRSLETGRGLGSARAFADFARVQLGTRQVQTSGDLRGTPAIIIHGRRDALVFPNLHSRAYYGLNQERERNKSRLTYIEVTPGQHFDAFISGLFLGPTGAAQFAPLHFYFLRAMDMMYAHLTSDAPLPVPQVVRPTPRGLLPYTPANVPTLLPAIQQNPAAGDQIRFADHVLTVPQ